jgi:MFS family permease
VKEKPASPLRRREFRLYFAGSVVSNVGTWMQNVVLNVFIFKITGGSNTWVGIAGFALFVPIVLFTLPGGVVADRRDRLRLLRDSQIVAGGFAAALAVLTATHAVNRYSAVALAFGIGVASAIAIPAMQALLPALVPDEELADAIALNAVTFNLARAVGPILAYAALAISAAWAFGLNALSFFVLAATLWLVRAVPFPREGGRPGPMREAINWAWNHVRTRTMLLGVAMIGLALDPITTLSPAYGRMLGNANRAGWIVSAWGLGAVLVIALAPALLRRIAEHGLGWLGLAVLAAGIATYAAGHTLLVVLAGNVVAGAGYIIAAVTFTAAIQQDVPEALRGRVMALWTFAFLGLRPVASLLDGKLADAFSPHWATLAFAAPALAAAVFVRRGTLAGAEPLAPPV